MRPMKGTPEYDLWVTAIEIAAAAPLKQRENVWAARVPWTMIDRLRTALDELGLDWETVKTESARARKAAGDE